MKSYKVFFEIFGKKMQYSCIARSKEDAEKVVRNKIKIHKIEEERIFDTGDILNSISSLFNNFFNNLKI